MKKLLSAFLILAIATSACGQTPVVPPVPAGPIVRVPSGPVVPNPIPATSAITVTKDKTYYVFDSDVPCIVLTSPAGLAKVTADAGPLKIRERFADDPSKVQTRTYKGPYVYSLEPAGSGPVELLVYPQGAKSESDVVRRLLLVDDGTLPKPPDPGPGPPPGPVNPPAPPVTTDVQAMIDAFKSDKQPATVAASLAVVCHQMADKWATDPSITINQDVLGKFSDLADPVLPKTSTPAIHKLIGGQLVAAFATSAGTPVNRDLVKTTFSKLATQLEGVK